MRRRSFITAFFNLHDCAFKKQHVFLLCIDDLYFIYEIEFDLKSINLLLFLKSLNKQTCNLIFHNRIFTLNLKRKLKGK